MSVLGSVYPPTFLGLASPDLTIGSVQTLRDAIFEHEFGGKEPGCLDHSPG